MTKDKRKISEILSEAKIIISFMGMIVVFFVGLYVRLNTIENNIETIQNNHLVHIQAAVDQNKIDIEETQETILEILLRIERFIANN